MLSIRTVSLIIQNINRSKQLVHLKIVCFQKGLWKNPIILLPIYRKWTERVSPPVKTQKGQIHYKISQIFF